MWIVRCLIFDAVNNTFSCQRRYKYKNLPENFTCCCILHQFFTLKSTRLSLNYTGDATLRKMSNNEDKTKNWIDKYVNHLFKVDVWTSECNRIANHWCKNGRNIGVRKWKSRKKFASLQFCKNFLLTLYGV